MNGDGLSHSPEDLFSGTAALFLASPSTTSSSLSFSRSLSLFREDRDGEQVCDRLFLGNEDGGIFFA